MRVRLKVFSVLREVIGKRSLILELQEGSVLKGFLIELDRRYGKRFHQERGRGLFEALTQRFNVFLNNKALSFPEDLGKELRDGDEVVILQPSSGG